MELARILFTASEWRWKFHHLVARQATSVHLDADSLGWLRDFLRLHTGGLVVISRNVDLVADVINKCGSWMPCAAGRCLQHGLAALRRARATDEQRRIRGTLTPNARRPRCTGRQVGRQDWPCGRTCCAAPIGWPHSTSESPTEWPDQFPAAAWTHTAGGQRSPGKTYGSLEVFTGIDLAIDAARG